MSHSYSHLFGQGEPNGASATADVQQQAVGPDTSQLADGVVQQTRSASIHLQPCNRV